MWKDGRYERKGKDEWQEMVRSMAKEEAVMTREMSLINIINK